MAHMRASRRAISWVSDTALEQKISSSHYRDRPPGASQIGTFPRIANIELNRGNVSRRPRTGLILWVIFSTVCLFFKFLSAADYKTCCSCDGVVVDVVVAAVVAVVGMKTKSSKANVVVVVAVVVVLVTAYVWNGRLSRSRWKFYEMEFALPFSAQTSFLRLNGDAGSQIATRISTGPKFDYRLKWNVHFSNWTELRGTGRCPNYRTIRLQTDCRDRGGRRQTKSLVEPTSTKCQHLSGRVRLIWQPDSVQVVRWFFHF